MIGQKEIISHKLPLSSVERLISVVSKVSAEKKIDLFMIN